MKNALVVAVAVLLAVVAVPAQAEDGRVSQATLSALGLDGLQPMSDAAGTQIRGMQGAGSVHGASLIVGQLATEDFKNFVIGSSGNQVEGNISAAGSGISVISKDHAVSLDLGLVVAFPNGDFFSGAITGDAGGAGSVAFTLP